MRCGGQKEIDLIRMREGDGKVLRIHVEVSVTTSGAYKKINSQPYSKTKMKTRSGSAWGELRWVTLSIANLTIPT